MESYSVYVGSRRVFVGGYAASRRFFFDRTRSMRMSRDVVTMRNDMTGAVEFRCA